MKKIIGGLLSLLLFTGCSLDTNTNKAGVVCDDADAVALAENILNNNILDKDIKDKKISKIKIDPQNIVIWDYKSGRYLCYAKVEGKILNNDFSTLFWIGNNYGLYEKNKTISGWIYYQTYMPTVEQKKAKNNQPYTFYVELIPNNKIKNW